MIAKGPGSSNNYQETFDRLKSSKDVPILSVHPTEVLWVVSGHTEVNSAIIQGRTKGMGLIERSLWVYFLRHGLNLSNSDIWEIALVKEHKITEMCDLVLSKLETDKCFKELKERVETTLTIMSTARLNNIE